MQIKATTDVANSRAAALDAVQSSKRLQQRIDALVSQAAHSASSPTPSTPTSDSVGLLADVLRRSSERSRLLADYADQARIAGLACEASYDALNPDPKDYANKSKN